MSEASEGIIHTIIDLAEDGLIREGGSMNDRELYHQTVKDEVNRRGILTRDGDPPSDAYIGYFMDYGLPMYFAIKSRTKTRR